MVRVNLLPIRTILRKREMVGFIYVAGGTVAAAVLIGFALWFYADWTITSLQDKQKRLQAQLAQLKEKNKEIENLKNEIARLEKQVDTIQKLTKTRDTPAPFMGAISLAVPDEVWITSLSKQGQSFSLDGTGADNIVVVNFVNRLLKIRQGFTAKQPFVTSPEEPTFFSDVKLLQIIASAKPGGLAAVQFKVTGTVR